MRDGAPEKAWAFHQLGWEGFALWHHRAQRCNLELGCSGPQVVILNRSLETVHWESWECRPGPSVAPAAPLGVSLSERRQLHGAVPSEASLAANCFQIAAPVLRAGRPAGSY